MNFSDGTLYSWLMVIITKNIGGDRNTRYKGKNRFWEIGKFHHNQQEAIWGNEKVQFTAVAFGKKKVTLQQLYLLSTEE